MQRSSTGAVRLRSSSFFFVALPPACAGRVRAAARAVSYGWGMVPVSVTLDGFTFTTSLFPKDETYFLPLRAAVRKTAGVALGDPVRITLTLDA